MASKKKTSAASSIITLVPVGPADLSEVNVMSVYSGRADTCCCGCAGKHTYASAHRTAASTAMGYTVDDADVNDKTVKRIINIIKKNPDGADCTLNSHVAVTVGKRLYIAYLLPTV